MKSNPLDKREVEMSVGLSLVKRECFFFQTPTPLIKGRLKLLWAFLLLIFFSITNPLDKREVEVNVDLSLVKRDWFFSQHQPPC